MPANRFNGHTDYGIGIKDATARYESVCGRRIADGIARSIAALRSVRRRTRARLGYNVHKGLDLSIVLPNTKVYALLLLHAET
jgi:hypothetical protein